MVYPSLLPPNIGSMYQINDFLKSKSREMHFGVFISSDFDFNEHIKKFVIKAIFNNKYYQYIYNNINKDVRPYS